MSCAATSPIGRLTQAGAGEPFVYQTKEGWSIRIPRDWQALELLHSNGLFKYELWGTPGGGDPSIVWTHENLSGKHIKDRFGGQRTHLLPGGTIVTVSTGGVPLVGTVSIYDDDETHRIALESHSVTRSCSIGMFEEANEHDGETSRFVDTEDGMLFEHVYDQAVSPAGVPLQKIEDIFPLGRVFLDNPNHVDDFFDDPRLGHT